MKDQVSSWQNTFQTENSCLGEATPVESMVPTNKPYGHNCPDCVCPVLIPLPKTHSHVFNFGCRMLQCRQTTDKLTPILQLNWVILTCVFYLILVQYGFFISTFATIQKMGLSCNSPEWGSCEQNVLITEKLQKHFYSSWIYHKEEITQCCLFALVYCNV